jgi:putative FmdB family regulatory protein
MPIYEYRRPDGTTFEIQQSFSDETLTKDPETGVAVERVLHAPAVHFKGKGFYNTDYGTRNRQRETAAAAESSKKESSSEKASSDSGSSSGSSDSATASSSESKPKAEKAAKDSSGSKSDASKSPAPAKK